MASYLLCEMNRIFFRFSFFAWVNWTLNSFKLGVMKNFPKYKNARRKQLKKFWLPSLPDNGLSFFVGMMDKKKVEQRRWMFSMVEKWLHGSSYPSLTEMARKQVALPFYFATFTEVGMATNRRKTEVCNFIFRLQSMFWLMDGCWFGCWSGFFLNSME